MRALRTVFSIYMLFGTIGLRAQPSPTASGTVSDQEKAWHAASKGFPLRSSVTRQQVGVQAVLLPAHIVRSLFGNEVGNNYAAVELIISNKNPDATFLIQSIYIDYGKWLLAGIGDEDTTCPPSTGNAGTPIDQTAANSASAESATGCTAGKQVDAKDSTCPPGIGSFRTPADQTALNSASAESATGCTAGKQVASAEYRLVRGEALDAQQWTARNWTMRALQLAGVIATGSEFAFKEQGIIKAIGAFTGQGVPAANTFWPDGTVPQLDRISDFGFHTNKVIPKASGDIVVAFFPIDRFITPGLKKIFLKSPAVFFVPGSILVDDKIDRAAKKVLNTLLGADSASKTIAEILQEPDSRKTLRLLSLDQVRVVVDGMMTVDPDTLQAHVDSIEIDGTPDWSKAGTITGVINGSLLSGGTPVVDDKSGGPKLAATAVADQSSDTALHFSLNVPDGVAGCNLDFHVTKTKAPDSNHYTFTVPTSAGQTCTVAPAKKP